MTGLIYRDPEITRLQAELQAERNKNVILQEEITKLHKLVRAEVETEKNLELVYVPSEPPITRWRLFLCWWGNHDWDLSVDRDGLKKPFHALVEEVQVVQVPIDREIFAEHCMVTCKHCRVVIKDYQSSLKREMVNMYQSMSIHGMIEREFEQFKKKRIGRTYLG